MRRRVKQLWKLKSSNTFYHAGDRYTTIGGTGFLIHKMLTSNIVAIKKISSRVIYIITRLNKRYFIKIVQVYAPTSSHAGDEVDVFYEDIGLAWKDQKTHSTFLCGYFNAKVGLRTDNSETALGCFGSEGRNYRSDTLLGFLLQKRLFLMDSFFRKKIYRRWTWQSRDSRTKNEIDYIMTDYKNTVQDVSVLN